jgi:hypothetical protein
MPRSKNEPTFITETPDFESLSDLRTEALQVLAFITSLANTGALTSASKPASNLLDAAETLLENAKAICLKQDE